MDHVSGSLGMVVFFASRIRHTRLVSDWSSDVCSSDLPTRYKWRRRLRALRRHTESVAMAEVYQQCSSLGSDQRGGALGLPARQGLRKEQRQAQAAEPLARQVSKGDVACEQDCCVFCAFT